MPSIDIDRVAAHDAAQRELAKPIYGKPSAARQFSDWANEVIYRLLQKAATIPGGWLTIMVLCVLFAVAVVVAVHVARHTMRTRRGGELFFGSAQLTAAQHRATAESYATEGDWVSAIRHRLRAVARQLEENGVLEPAPGRTANELARDAGAAMPHLSGELSQAAVAFNDVTYGERPGTPDAYRMIADLDDRLRHRSVAAVPPAGPAAAAESWAQVR